MSFKNQTRRSLLVLLALGYFHSCASQNFDRTYTGVTFTPYIKIPFNDTTKVPHSTYTVPDIRAMLDVISRRFSRVVTWSVGSNNVTYIHNATYYQSNIEIRIAEVAARINRRRGKKAITVLQGVWLHDGPQMITETHLALECAEKANQIYPGTVDGLIFSRNEDSDELPDKHLLKYIKFSKRSRAGTNLKIGLRMDCSKVIASFEDEWDSNDYILFKKVLQISDFVTCEIKPENFKKGAEAAFNSIGVKLLESQRHLQNVSSAIKVMGQIKWDSDGDFKWQNVENLKIYWEVASVWARQNDFPIWYFEAFDNPEAKFYSGWWRLTDNSKSDRTEAYYEKILELQTEDPPKPWDISLIIVGVSVGILLFATSLVAVAFLRFRVKKLEQQLSEKDIQEFMKGDESGENFPKAYAGDRNMANVAHNFPYDTSFEIRKSDLHIDDKILGVGQFGCVYTATITPQPDVVKCVALKVAKEDCPRYTLKGFLSEIKVLIYIGQHPNIVALCGAYTAELHKGVVYIATELCSLGSLETYLRNCEGFTGIPDDTINETRAESTLSFSNEYTNMTEKSRGSSNDTESDPKPRTKISFSVEYRNVQTPVFTNFQEMLKWSQEIACGMQYLGTKHVVHADLATRNVLLDGNKTAKIGDFGLSRRMYNYTNYVKTAQEPLPWRWMAIESLNKAEFSVKSDVWSYGVTLWEIFSGGNSPYPGLSWTADFASMLVNGMRLDRPVYSTTELYTLMVGCWSMEPSKRLTFRTISKILKDMTVFKSTDSLHQDIA